jgi:hypothetical protein
MGTDVHNIGACRMLLPIRMHQVQAQPQASSSTNAVT